MERKEAKGVKCIGGYDNSKPRKERRTECSAKVYMHEKGGYICEKGHEWMGVREFVI